MLDLNWSNIAVTGDPRLLIGRRPRPRQLEGVRIDLHSDTFDDLALIAQDAVDLLAATVARPYEPFAALEEGEEHFELALDGVFAADGEDAALFRLLAIVDDLDAEDARDLKNQRNAFYALCWPDSPEPVSVVKKMDPARAVRHARSFQQADTLRRVENPDLILHDSVDFVVAGNMAGIIRDAPFRLLLSDTQVALENVPSYVDSISQALAGTVPLAPSSLSALTASATARISHAQRMGRLVDRLSTIALTRAQIEQASLQHLGDAHALLNASGELLIEESTVSLVLDLLEGRLFEDDFSGERRRADRWSPRT